VLPVTPLLRELVLRIVEWGALDRRVPLEQSVLDVLLAELSLAGRNLPPETPLLLPLPAEGPALSLARRILAEPSCPESLSELSRQFGAGRRTLERVFRRDTGLSFGMWRQKARLLDSIRRLAEGKSVTEAALDSGYSSASAFVAAFKKTFGYTPGRL
jgi:AraC-like DNA-binding protein